MRTGTYLAAAALSLLVAGVAFAATTPASELHITPDGKFSARNVTVMQKSGSVLYTRIMWGNAFVRLTIVPPKEASGLVKNNGGVATYDDIQAGDILAVDGTLQDGADTLLVNATKLKDLSLNKEPKTLSGVVKSVDYSGSFILPDKKLGNVKVFADGNTTITKGVRSIALGEVVPGDKVSAVVGTYDYTTGTMAATSFTVYQDPAVFKARNFEGTLKSFSGTSLPMTAVVTVGSKDYTMYFAANATITNKAKASVELTRFTVGDRVSVYGSIRQANILEVDATSLRNLSF